MIVRTDYIEKIKPLMDVPLVKILAGVRRSGKSTIFEMLREELLRRGVEKERIVFRRYNEMKWDGCTAGEMYDDLAVAVRNGGRHYVFLDELQEVDGWEKVVNSLLESADVDLYITGSNSRLMASEIETYLSGRYVSVPVYTLSFGEYLKFKGKPESAARETFGEYLRFGGFPLIGAGDFDAQTAYQIVDGVYSSVVTRDIAKRHSIRNRDLFDRVVRFVIENVGKTFSANSIVKFLKGEHRTISVETIYNYLRWLTEAFIVYPCRRYDLRGKTVLKTQEKYYLSDISFKYCEFGFNPSMVAAALENIVYLDLCRRGYTVYIGINGSKEIDFVAEKHGEKIYVQVCKELPAGSSRETENLLEIDDNYPKYVVTTDEFASGNDNGIRFVHIADFLLKETL